MPILKVLGFGRSISREQALIKNLKYAVASVKELGVTTDQVTPFIMNATQAKPNEVIVIEVYGLFQEGNNGVIRNKPILEKICRNIFISMWGFLLGNGITETQLIEVIVDPRVDRDKGEYFSANPQTWKPEQLKE